jgi:hypothetical protein
LLPAEQNDQPLDAIPVLSLWVRGTLVAMTVGLLAVFGIAIWLRPYDEAGRPLTQATHRQLGLPPCTFYDKTGLPCPSCGMTTSFALLMHGDVWHSLRANWVGTLLAAFCLALIPWNLASAVRGKPLWIWSLERALTRLVIIFLVLLFLRWAIVLLLIWGRGGPAARPWNPGANPPAESRRRDHGYTLEALALGRPDPDRPGLRRRLRHYDHALLHLQPLVRQGFEAAPGAVAAGLRRQGQGGEGRHPCLRGPGVAPGVDHG